MCFRSDVGDLTGKSRGEEVSWPVQQGNDSQNTGHKVTVSGVTVMYAYFQGQLREREGGGEKERTCI